LVALSIVILVVAAALFVALNNPPDQTSINRSPLLPSKTSGDPTGVTSCGIADVLLTDSTDSFLAGDRGHLPQYQGSRKSLRTSPKKLNVDALVEGPFRVPATESADHRAVDQAATEEHPLGGSVFVEDV
jgi:hypothetical protein